MSYRENTPSRVHPIYIDMKVLQLDPPLPTHLLLSSAYIATPTHHRHTLIQRHHRHAQRADRRGGGENDEQLVFGLLYTVPPQLYT